MSMFKGLKAKVQEEAKKIQSTVSLAGETLASQVRSRQESEATGSEAGSTTDVSRDAVLVDVADSAPLQTSSLMQGFSDSESADVRARRDSVTSVGSGDSLNLFAPLPSSASQRLEAIHSDVESVATESGVGSSVLRGASREQISTVLHKLQGRAANYKDRYRHLAKSYNELIREYEKCRTVLTQTQDKALQRIEKLRDEKQANQKSLKDLRATSATAITERDAKIITLQHQLETRRRGSSDAPDAADASSPRESASDGERVKKLEQLLNRCKESIKTNKEKLQAAAQENETLKAALTALEDERVGARATAAAATGGAQGEAGVNELINERVSAEWRGKLEQAEKEWAARLSDADERSVMAVASAKQEMHDELERKDAACQSLLQRVRALEADVKQSSEEAAGEKEQLQRLNVELEEEKKELVVQLSKTKQDAVRLEEEQLKRDSMLAEHCSQLKSEMEKFTKQLDEAKSEHDASLANQEAKWAQKLSDYEQQTQLAIEEREMQKAAAIADLDARCDAVSSELQLMTTEKLRLESAVEQLRDDHRARLQELSQTIETNAARHRAEADALRADLGSATARADAAEAAASAAGDGDAAVAAELSARQAELDSMQRAAAEQSRAFEALLAEKTALDGAIESTSSERDELRRQLEELSNAAQRRGEEIQELTAARTALSEQLAERQRSVDQIATELQEHRQLVDNLKSALSSKESESVESAGVIDQTRVMLEDRTQELAAKTEEFAEVEKKLVGLASDLAAKQAQVDSDELTMEQLRATVDDLRLSLREGDGAQANRIAQLDAELASVRVDLVASTARLAELSASAQDTCAEREAFQSQLDAARIDLQNRSSECDVQLEQLRDELRLMKEDGERRVETEQQLRTDCEQLRAALTEASAGAAQLFSAEQVEKQVTERMKPFENELEQLRGEVLTKDAEVREAGARLQDVDAANVAAVQLLRTELVDKNEAVQKSEAEISELHRQKESLALKCGELSASLSALQLSLSAAESLKAELEKSREEDAAAKAAAIAQVEARLQTADGERSMETQRLHAELAALKDGISAAKSDRAVLLAAGQKQSSELSQLQDQMAVKERLWSTEKAQYEESIAALEAALGGRVDQLEKMQSVAADESAAQRRHIVALEARSSEGDRSLQAETAAVVALRADLDSNLLQLEDVKAELQSTKLTKSELEEQLCAQKAALDGKVAEYKKKAESKLAQLKKQLETEREALQGELNAKERELNAEWSKKLAALETECEQLRAAESGQSDAAAERDRLNERVGVLEDGLAASHDKLNALETLVTEKDAQLEASAELRGQVKRLEAELLEHDDRRTALADQVDQLRRRAELADAQLTAAADEHEQQVKRLTKDYDRLLEEREAEWQTSINQSYSKTDEDRNRISKEYQREVKQLYNDLNTRTQAYNDMKLESETKFKQLNDEMDRLKGENEALNEQLAAAGRAATVVDADEADSVFQLQSQVRALEEKLAALCGRDYGNALADSTRTFDSNAASASQLHVQIDRNVDLLEWPSSPLFAEPTEAEYLRNVLFRYMTERETLGRESVTLARVIASVLKFDANQMRRVVATEETRQTGVAWPHLPAIR